MPRSLGQSLEPQKDIKVRCGKSACENVTHHDHMYDYVHQLFLNRLSPRIHGDRGERRDFGRAFGAFVREHGATVLKQLDELGFDGESSILRFAPTTVCSCYNAVDGNGKTHPNHQPIDPLDRAYWSMTPEELAKVHKGDATWIAIFGKRTDRDKRRENAERYVEAKIHEWNL